MNEAIKQLGHAPERYAWNKWERAAKERGMERTLAELGREVLRDADQHNWSPQLRSLCNPSTLEKLLLAAPYLGRRICEILIETDGLRVAYPECNGKLDIIRLPGFGGLS